MSDQPLGIPEPATTDEVVSGRPFWKVCCVGCCSGILVIIVLLFASLRFFSGPGPRVIASLPEQFPVELTLYRPEEAREIVYYPAHSKSAVVKLVTGPLDWVRRFTPKNGSSELANGLAVTNTVAFVNDAMRSRLTNAQGYDTVAIRWSDVAASSNEILKFYAGSLKQAGIRSPQMRRDDATGTNEMVGTADGLRVNLLLVDNPKTPNIVDNVSIVVEYKAQSERL
jgi:hypothetical protein